MSPRTEHCLLRLFSSQLIVMIWRRYILLLKRICKLSLRRTRIIKYIGFSEIGRGYAPGVSTVYCYMCGHPYLGWLEGIVTCEMYVEEEDATFIHGARWTEDCWHPLVQVVAFWTSTATQTGYTNHQIQNITLLVSIGPALQHKQDTPITKYKTSLY